MDSAKPPFGRALLAGVVGVATLLPWHELRFGHANAWSTNLTLGGMTIPLWLVLPLALFSVAISWGAHRRWHDFPKAAAMVLDALACVLSTAAVLLGSPGIGTLIGFLAVSFLCVVDVIELRRDTPRARREKGGPSIRTARIRIWRRRRRASAGASIVHPMNVPPAESASD